MSPFRCVAAVTAVSLVTSCTCASNGSAAPLADRAAEGAEDDRARERAQRPGRHYDPSAEVTVAGVVQSVDLVRAARRLPFRVQLELKVGAEVLNVHLGPQSYLDEIELELHIRDEIEVVGSRTGETIIAREIRRGEEHWTLRDHNGVPRWRRPGRR